jgi:acetyl esterase/lipase
MPQVAAQTCLGDVTSAFKSIRQLHPAARLVLVGSSSGGELAAFLSQALAPGSLSGILLRCPVTADAPAHVPSGFEDWHTSASPPFVTSLLGLFNRQVPRDGFERMPLEIPTDEVEGLEMARTWVQVCTNDVLYSDGVCYAKLLQDAGIEVKVDVVEGWPHTFWLKAPHLDRALEADNELLRGLAWVLEL